MRILVVEDDVLLAQALSVILSNQNYAVEVVKDGQAGWEMVEAFEYDLILLDVILPKLDGVRLCQKIRSQGYQMPILLLTGRDNNHDKAVGLDAGADDYVVKPFDQEELVARIRALLRRAGSLTQPLLEWGQLRLDPSNCEVTYSTQLLSLTPKEYAMLELFLRNHRRVFSCDAILEHLWTYEDAPGEEAVRTHIKGLRQKLKAAGAAADFIETVYGIGYRLKPLENLKASIEKDSQTSKASLTATPQSVQHQTMSLIAGVWHRFKDRVSEQVTTLEQAVTALTENRLSAELQQQALREAHTLAGSLGTFGLAEGSRLAGKIESLLRNGKSLKQARQLRELITGLRQEIEQSHSIDHRADASQLLKGSPLQATDDDRPLLLVVDPDRTFTEALVSAAEPWGIRIAIAPDLRTARDRIAHHAPNVVLLDLDCSAQVEAPFGLLTELNSQMPPVPVLVFARQNGLAERVEVARRGGRIFLQKPVLMEQVFEAITQVLRRAEMTQAKVMVVDDDPKVITILKNLLEPWSLKVIALSDPRQFLETLEACSPDLLVLDVEMPYVNGVELCQVVRNDLRWSSLPVLFLTAHTESGMVAQVFSQGADDFVSKPIVGPELITRILNRLERMKLLRRLTEIDPLTGVFNRHKSSQNLEDFLRLATRSGQPVSLAVLDLDHLKRVNDQHGYATGDAVLRQFGHLLRQSFQSEDVVARWGGEEFVIGMYGMTKEAGVQRLVNLVETLHQRFFTSLDGHSFQVTFSAGVAQYPEDGTSLQLLCRSADAALQQAKRQGRAAPDNFSLRVNAHHG